MSTAGTFLSKIQVLIEVDYSVRAGIHTVLAAGAFDRIDDDQSVIPAINCAFHFAGIHARSILAVVAEDRVIGYFHPGDLAANILR